MKNLTTGSSPEAQATARAYRCVCGTLIGLDGSTLRCGVCGREITDSTLPGQTVIVGAGDRDDSPAGDMDDLIGCMLGHFRIEQRLGSGGMGAVYRAVDTSLQRDVALKVLKTTIGADSAVISSRELAELLMEARAQARVNHPNVVHIYYVSRTDETPFLAMELVSGPTLEDLLKQRRLPFREIASIALQTAKALRQAARFGIVHGDIKPGNILIAEGGVAKLSDFGLSHDPVENPEAAKRIAGTPDYMAPEVCGGSPAGILSDQYSLGVMLFEMTFGRLPYSFSDNSFTSRVVAHQSQAVELPDRWPAEFPEAWRNCLLTLLQKSPRGRYPDFDAVVNALTRVQPLPQQSAGRLTRTLSWMVDFTLFTTVQTLFAIPIELGVLSTILGRFLGGIFALPLILLPPALLFAMHYYYGRGLGKRLFQLRIVDNHGLQPPRMKLALRSLFAFSLVYATAVTLLVWGNADTVTINSGAAGGVASSDKPPLMALFISAVSLFWIVDAGCGLFRKHGRSLHDAIFRTRVVLESGGGHDAAENLFRKSTSGPEQTPSDVGTDQGS